MQEIVEPTFKSTCGVCNKIIAKNHRKIKCSICNLDIHIKCNKTDAKTFDEIYRTNTKCICILCNEKNFPFFNLTDENFLNSTNTGLQNDINSQYNFSPSVSLKEFFKGINDFVLINNKDDEDEFVPLNCKYLDINSFNQINNKKQFSLFHLNIASLAKHKQELEVILSLLNYKFDIIGITETKIIKNIPPIFDTKIDGYKCYSTPTESDKGGTILYVADHFHPKPRKDYDSLIYKSKELESVFIEIINPGKKNIIIGCIYRHPTMDGQEFKIDFLDPLMEKLVSENKRVFLIGDFNYDLLKIESDINIANFFDTLTSNLFVPHIIHPTRITLNTKSLIDNIFSNSPNFLDGISGNLTITLSDHLAQFLIINEQNYKIPLKHNFYKRDTKQYDKASLIADLLELEWPKILELERNDPNFSFNSFETNVNTVIDKYIPLKKLTRKEIKMRIKPWINNDICKAIKIRETLYRKFIKAKDPLIKEEYFNNYKVLRNQIVTLCRESKKLYYQNFFSKNCNNLKNTWKGIKSIINIKSKNTFTPTSILNENGIISEPVEVANAFNDYFSSIAGKLQAKIHQNGLDFTKYLLYNNPHSFFIEPTDKFEVLNIINDLNVSKACGPHSIPTDIFHSIKLIVAEPLTKIINLSFVNGIYIDNLKASKVLPIYKEKGSNLDCCNYRPISLLSNINKIFEKLIHKRLYNFLLKHNCIYKYQFGFRENHSTNHALINLTEDIRDALDNHYFACGTFIDLQKAFDTVDHKILLRKLEHYGVRGKANEWFNSYLSNRKQHVSINGFLSNETEMLYGVPQGSVLGPLLFLIYINDLHVAIKHSTTRHFADDTSLLIKSKSLNQLKNRLNLDLRFLCKWLRANKISLNASKTELLIFHHHMKKIDYDLKIKINGKRLLPSKYVKYLGITIDCHLNWNHQIDFLSAKLSRANGMLAKIRHLVPTNIIRNIYYAIFSSLMTYGSIIWGQADNNYTKRITILQNKALRNITFSSPRESTNPIYHITNVLKFVDNIKLQNFLYVYDSLNRRLPTVLNNTFEPSNRKHLYPTKFSLQHQIPLFKVNTLAYGLNSIKYKAISFWNNMVKKFPEKKLQNLRRNACKLFVTKYIIDSYKE